MVIRPKSIATVVVFFCSTPSSRSTPTPACVIDSSVCSGRISLTAPTRVVLPTPKPPATRILSARNESSRASAPPPLRSARPAESRASSKRPESIDHLLEDGLVEDVGLRQRQTDPDVPDRQQVAEQ